MAGAAEKRAGPDKLICKVSRFSCHAKGHGSKFRGKGFFMTEHRHYQRIGFRTEATLVIKQRSYPCPLVDLALQGALFSSTAALPVAPGERAQICIRLPDSNIELNFEAELIHLHNHFYGFLFLSEDAETMAHLRRLLELNIGDDVQTDEEFAYWLKQNHNA